MTEEVDDALREEARKELANLTPPPPDDRDLPKDIEFGDPTKED